VDNQPDVEVHVLQGEGRLAEENTSLARFRLGRLSPAPAREPQIEVTFEIDVNGILQVTAQDQGTKRQQNITVRAASGLSQSEVERARREQAAFEKAWRRDVLPAQLMGLIQSTQKTLELLRTKLTREEQVLAERRIREAGAAKDGSLEEMRVALSNLESVAEMLGQALMRGSEPPEIDPDEPPDD
jgi:molecular chaperone DnaK